VRIQIIVALIAFLLLRITRTAFAPTVAPLEFATLVRVAIMQRRTIRDLLDLPEPIPRSRDQDQAQFQWA
ncbi:MAG: IS4 family transposase, partial [Rhodospirillales bacterium]|nr:IS4 family transposase [Rhodospirillales bacterium]MBN8926426.1 IS4 family transposase [Rhodospirillales bacterium]